MSNLLIIQSHLKGICHNSYGDYMVLYGAVAFCGLPYFFSISATPLTLCGFGLGLSESPRVSRSSRRFRERVVIDCSSIWRIENYSHFHQNGHHRCFQGLTPRFFLTAGSSFGSSNPCRINSSATSEYFHFSLTALIFNAVTTSSVR